MRINNNIQALNTHRQMTISTGSLSKSAEKLSSGYRINRAGDDAAGLTISEKMRNQIKGLQQASTNAQDGISLIQTAEGALGEVHEILKTMRQKVLDYGNGTKTTEDREAIYKQMSEQIKEIDRIASTTEFNTMTLLKGDFTTGKELNLQIGANKNQVMAVAIASLTVSALGLRKTATATDGPNMLTTNAAGVSAMVTATLTMSVITASALVAVDEAIKTVSAQRSSLGAYQNRLENTINNLNVSAENLTAAESRIRDVDMAKEITEYQKNNILMQASQSMLAQSNQASQSVLSLLG